MPIPRLSRTVIGSLLASLCVVATADQLEPGNFTVQGSSCVGFDCVNNEAFLGATLVLKENNTRIRLEASNAPAMLGQSWNLEANNNLSGGFDYFRIELKSIDASMTAPILTLGPAAQGDITLGRDSDTVAGQFSIGNPTLLRRLRHVAQGVADSDALVQRTLGTFSTLEDKRALVSQLAAQIDDLEARVAELENGDLDGDGIPNIDDDFPNATTAVVVGGLTLDTTPATGGSNCSVESAEIVPVSSLAPPPEGLRTIANALAFTLSGCALGESVEIAVDLGQPIVSGFRAYKVGDNWREIEGATVAGSLLRYTVTDGGPYDADGVVNGVIVDPVTVALPAMAIPLPGAWVLALLVGVFGAVRLRYHVVPRKV